MAEPRPVVTLTLIPPIILHTRMYQIMFLLPYLNEGGVRFGVGERGYGENGDGYRLGTKVEHDREGSSEKDSDVNKESWGDEELLELFDLANGGLLGTCGAKGLKMRYTMERRLRTIESNDGGADLDEWCE